ncbi:orotate phosphoribosyltransferase [Aestuariimicrobium sp. p3-SID1156]|uniref:orotate phosphoribosyltransferase n=1 Tax=Aestuariimicrobium sp. p3-SID1156 TaxID=2916038 RepID=UPI00223B2845|nr:orotate phosphoribosyltransferase [Aestuariimicrobium sp. p3-SID1156]MCT1459116.1 orotate phosphoribosyltransferase [Aestuariimicrobium sp. p3-SID1156]
MTDTAAFIDFLLESDVLTFGDFVTKSGRSTPYFVNTGKFHSGPQLARLGEFYADAALDAFGDFDVFFGPAYKGIPLSVATSIALAARGRQVAFSSLRKEEKDHGDKGAWLGRSVQAGDRVVIIEDVTTAGTSIRESMPALRDAGAEVVGLVIAVDRQERGTGERTALAEVGETWGIPTTSIATIDEIVGTLRGQGRLDEAMLARIAGYRAQWGAAR